LSGQYIHLANCQVYRDLQTMYPNMTVAFQWVPGHRDVEGNKLGDVEAKAGAEAEEQVKELTESCRRAEAEGWKANAPSDGRAEAEETRETREKREKGEGEEPIFSKLCWGLEGLGKATTALRAAHKAQVMQGWVEQWASAPTGAALRLIDRAPPGPRVARLRIGLPRPHSSLLTQHRTGRSHLNASLHTIGIHPTGLCDCSKLEMLHHFLLACPLHRRARQQLQHNVEDNGFDLCSLFSKPLCIPATLHYITATDRFPRYFATPKPPSSSPSPSLSASEQRRRARMDVMRLIELQEEENAEGDDDEE